MRVKRAVTRTRAKCSYTGFSADHRAVLTLPDSLHDAEALKVAGSLRI